MPDPERDLPQWHPSACRSVVVDAFDARAGGFYEHHGFTMIPGKPHRLVQKMGDVAAALDGLPGK